MVKQYEQHLTAYFRATILRSQQIFMLQKIEDFYLFHLTTNYAFRPGNGL